MSISGDLFHERLERFLKSWKDDESGSWTDVSAVIIVTGKRDPAVLQYLKSVAFHQWLFGIEVAERSDFVCNACWEHGWEHTPGQHADVVLLFTKSEMRIITFEGKKAKVLKDLKPAAEKAGCPLSFFKVPKGGDAAPACKEAIQFVQESGGSIAGLAKLKQSGPLCDAFGGVLQSEGVQLTDVALCIGKLLVTHDRQSDLQNSKKAGFLTSSVMNVAVKRIEDNVDKRKHPKHSKLSEIVQEMITNPAKHQIKLKADACEHAYLPVVASGGAFTLRIGAECDTAKLHDGVVMLHLGARYNQECSNICRTLFFRPTPQMDKMYTAVLTAQKAAIAALQPGKPLSAAHGAVIVSLTSSGFEELVPKLAKNVGFGTGLELRESRLQLTATNDTLVAPRMVFNVCVGVSGLSNPDAVDEKDKTFAIQVADTVVVVEGGAPEELTRFSGKSWNDVSYVIKEDDEADGSDVDELDDLHGSQPRSSRENIAEQNLGRGRRNAARAAETAENAENAIKRKQRQDLLSKRKNEETYKRLTAKAGDDDGEKTHMRSVTNAACYQSVASVPPRRNSLISIDANAEALLIPVMGMLIPIHIMTVKSIIYSQDGESNDKVHSFVRIQFHHNTQYDARASNPSAALIKELAFRSTNSTAAQKFVQEAQALRRQVAVRDKEAAERATLVAQEKLQRYSNRQPHRLQDVWIQPPLSAKRKVPGNLDAHYNGFRYQMQGGESLDVTFSNIQHAFFQESDNELITLVHFSLKDPIMAGKKKVTDVQFYTEVMENNTAVDGRRSAYDPDEIEEERRDRERRLKINNEFRRFTKKVQDQWDAHFAALKLEWDTPFRDLAFSGIRGKSTVTLMPTVHCLVQLIETPYTVVPLSDVEIVNLERVGFNGKTFDLVVVFKDFDRETLMIGSVPAQSLDDIKNWLTTQDIKFFESKLNLQWKQILKTIVADPDEFLQGGGWAGFLDADGSEGEQEEEEISEEFKPSSEEEEEEESSDSGSGGSVVDSDDESEDGGYSNDSEEEEGKDWDALEEEARRADKIRDDDVQDEPRRGKGGDLKRPRGSMGGSQKHSGKPSKKRR